MKKIKDLDHRTLTKITQGAPIAELSKMMELTEAEVAKFMKIHDEMDEIVEDETVQDANQNLWTEVTEILVKLTAAVKSAIEPTSSDASRLESDQKKVRVGAKVKAPEMKLPTFRGHVREFRSFWDQFAANVDNSDLDPVQKLTILLAHLDGKARNAVSGYSIAGDNY